MIAMHIAVIHFWMLALAIALLLLAIGSLYRR
jgi:hypothetical protein